MTSSRVQTRYEKLDLMFYSVLLFVVIIEFIKLAPTSPRNHIPRSR